jgi:hypothetical protein
VIEEDLLIEGERYFLVWYYDEEMRIPDIETHIFVGKNVFSEPDAPGQDAWYFQDPDSYVKLGIFSSIQDKSKCQLLKADKDTLESLYDLDGLIQELAERAE